MRKGIRKPHIISVLIQVCYLSVNSKQSSYLHTLLKYYSGETKTEEGHYEWVGIVVQFKMEIVVHSGQELLSTKGLTDRHAIVSASDISVSVVNIVVITAGLQWQRLNPPAAMCPAAEPEAATGSVSSCSG